MLDDLLSLANIAFSDSQASLRSIRTEIRTLKSLVEHEARQQNLLDAQANLGKSIGDLDSVSTTEQHLEVNHPSHENTSVVNFYF